MAPKTSRTIETRSSSSSSSDLQQARHGVVARLPAPRGDELVRVAVQALERRLDARQVARDVHAERQAEVRRPGRALRRPPRRAARARSSRPGDAYGSANCGHELAAARVGEAVDQLLGERVEPRDERRHVPRRERGHEQPPQPVVRVALEVQQRARPPLHERAAVHAVVRRPLRAALGEAPVGEQRPHLRVAQHRDPVARPRPPVLLARRADLGPVAENDGSARSRKACHLHPVSVIDEVDDNGAGHAGTPLTSTRLRTFPVALRGSSSMKTTSRGHLEAGEVVLRRACCTSSSVSSSPTRRTTNAAQPLAELVVVDADDRDLVDRRVVGEQVLDLAREDVLAAGDDHLVVAAVDEQPAVAVEVPDVARRHQAVDRRPCRRRRCSPRTASRCRRRSGRSRPAATSRPSLVVEPHDRAARRAPGGAGRRAQVLGRGDRRPGDLGRAVEVVEDVAELVHDLGRRGRPGSAEPLAAMIRSERRVVAGAALAPAARRIRCSITGTTASAVAPGARRSPRASPRGRSGAAGRASTPSTSPSVKCAKPQEWNIGAAIIVRSRARSGIASSSAAAGVERAAAGCAPAPFGVPVVPLT